MFLLRIYKRIKYKQLLGRIQYKGEKVHIDLTTRISNPEEVRIESYVHIQPNCYLQGGGGITIGEGTILAHEIQILSQNHFRRKLCLLHKRDAKQNFILSFLSANLKKMKNFDIIYLQ